MKNKKRKFEGKELAFAIKGLNNKKQEKEWLDYQIQYHDLMLNTGLEMNYKKNVRDFKHNKSEHVRDLEIVKNVIKILQTQIREGVDIIEEVKEKNDEDTTGEETKLENN